MANLKLDLVNKLNNDKFYAEIELIRLAQDPAIKYSLKINEMQQQLSILAILNAEFGLIEQYFPEPQAPAPAQADAVPVAETPKAEAKAEEPKTKGHQGQSHSEG